MQTLPIISTVTLALWAGVFAGQGASAAERPNIVFLLTDDQRADTIHALGNDEIITPTLDRMAEDGLCFRHAYCQGSFTPAVCLASRLMFITGQNWEALEYRNRSGSGEFGGKVCKTGFVHPGTPLLPELFNEAGYYTGAIIKRGPTPKSLEGYFTFTHELNVEIDRLGGFCGKLPIDVAHQFLEEYDESEAGKNNDPFFLYIGFGGPHDERFIDKKYLDMYEEKPSIPDNYLPAYSYANGFSMFGRDDRLVGHPRTEEMIRTELHYYYGMITSIDENIGRLIQTLKDRGEFENTIFVFSSDHGLSIGSHGLLGKQNLYEEAMKAPLIIAGPGIPQNVRSDANVYLHDLYSTFCDLAGIPVPEGLHSKSLLPVIKGEAVQHRESIYIPFGPKMRSLRKGKWKLIKFLNIERPQLFNLENDPGEKTDLAGNPEYRKVVEKMERELATAMDEHGSDAKWQTKYKQAALTPISVEEVAAQSKAVEAEKGPVKEAVRTEDARRKAGHTL